MMKILIIILVLAVLPITVVAAEEPAKSHERHGSSAGQHDMKGSPKPVEGLRKYADDAQPGNQKTFSLQPIHDNEPFAVFMGDRFEYQTKEGKPILLWDIQAWAGSDYHKLYLKSEGTWLEEGDEFEEVEVELLYSRNMTTFWDLQAGIRHDFRPKPTRTFAALGVQGLAPYWFEIDATAYISEDGDISANIEAEYDLLLTQRLILQPRLEINLALQEVEELHIGRGINDIELGLRLRYEIRRKIAPYIGLSWSRKLGKTANLTESVGEDIDKVSFVLGLKVWF